MEKHPKWSMENQKELMQIILYLVQWYSSMFQSTFSLVKKRIVRLLFTSCPVYSSAGAKRKDACYAQVPELKLVWIMN